ncbi:hypothetical protein ABIC61_000033 [Curtobacterium sp. 1544]
MGAGDMSNDPAVIAVLALLAIAALAYQTWKMR